MTDHGAEYGDDCRATMRRDQTSTPPADEQRQGRAEQKDRRRLRYLHLVEAHGVDTQLKRGHVVRLCEAQTECFADVRRQEGSDVRRNSVVSADQRISRLCLLQIS